jgi:ABC-type glycerol-3-phosphate transport system permease component
LGGRAEVLFYRSMLGIPLPMAVMPVLYFLLAAAWLNSIWLLISALVLGVGHITVTLRNFQKQAPVS